jgi:triosephosphate isomerase
MKYLIANWKMNKTLDQALDFQEKFNQKLKLIENPDLKIILAPSFPFLSALKNPENHFSLASQTLSAPDFGAFTGDVSGAQLRGLVDYSLVGHSERRILFHETDEDVSKKIAAALENEITPVICFGETAEIRAAGNIKECLKEHLTSALNSVDHTKILLAYEPVWAISTFPGAKPATTPEISETIQIIHEILDELDAKNIPLLYGGSVSLDNISEYLQIPGISGFLVGGTSLDVDKFYDIIETMRRV